MRTSSLDVICSELITLKEMVWMKGIFSTIAVPRQDPNEEFTSSATCAAIVDKRKISTARPLV